MTGGRTRAADPSGARSLSRRARYFVEGHGLRVPRRDLTRCREVWLKRGIPAAEIDRAVTFQERWGGFALPPAPAYEGGPRVLEADVPEGSAADGWRFPAGGCRVSMEALALADHAGHRAKTITGGRARIR